MPLAQDTAVGLVERLLADSSLGRVVLELRASSGQATWAVGSREGERLARVVRELVPGCRVSRGFSRRAVDQAVVVSARPVGVGLAAERLSAVVRAILAALASTAEDEELVVQLQLGRRFSPEACGRVEPQGWLELLGLVPVPSLSGERGRRMRAQVGRHRAAASLRLGVRAASPLRQRTLLQGLLGALRLLEGPGVRLRARTEHPAKLDAVRRPWRAGLELGAVEIVAMAGWPVGELPLPLLGSGHPRQIAPPPEVGSGSSQRVVGASAVPGKEELVRLPISDAIYHTHLLGPTGVGKSTVLLALALADAAEGRGLLLLDPKGDLATDFLARLPEERADDVVVLDPTNPCPVGFNPLAGPPELAVVTAEAVLGVLAELFRDSWGIRTADVLSAALLTLARIPQATLVWLVPLLTNPAFRRRVLALAPPDPLGTDVFWQGYEAKPVRTQAVEVAPVLNKLRQLMLRPGLRAMLGQAQPRFGLTDLLERRRIVVVNLNQGLLGAGAARLLGTLLVAQLWQHLLARQAEPPERRQIVSVYIDEVQAFLAGLPGSLADALAQARSLGAAFHLAHQYRGQLSAEMIQAVETNTRSKVYFALSATDAAAAARLAPELEAADFQLLAQYQAYATVMHHGRPSGWFSLATRPAPPPVRDPALLYAASHARYGIPAEQTEAELIALTSGTAPSAVDANERHNPATTTDATAATTDDVTNGGPEDETAGEPTPDATPDEAGSDGTSNGTEAESGRSRPAIGRRRRP
ncbi:type IV secretory system conjugative DNA transfer family protein [Actinomyces sp. oral taxon 171]|uniref:type IV secretory system conjugative DNA transfer family protein n=2 Tax=Actinomyces sp. oral taxon 171 TaxID=706438 RepID=UPI0021F237BB|nr:type IV secretion system DNA-binding domain-containing protein [Actinomyces sp. oral taxon 171]